MRSRSPRALILHGYLDRRAELFGRTAREIRIAQELARHHDEIGIAVGNDVLRLFRFGDEADRRGRDAGFALMRAANGT